MPPRRPTSGSRRRAARPGWPPPRPVRAAFPAPRASGAISLSASASRSRSSATKAARSSDVVSALSRSRSDLRRDSRSDRLRQHPGEPLGQSRRLAPDASAGSRESPAGAFARDASADRGTARPRAIHRPTSSSSRPASGFSRASCSAARSAEAPRRIRLCAAARTASELLRPTPCRVQRPPRSLLTHQTTSDRRPRTSAAPTTATKLA